MDLTPREGTMQSLRSHFMLVSGGRVGILTEPDPRNGVH